MSGRFSLTTPWDLIKKRFDVNIPVHDYRLRYNAAPGQELWVIPEETPNDAQLFHWGLVPFWAKDQKIGTRLINARAETIAEKPAFRTPFKKHRCLVLADGFYEWDRKGARRVPYRVVLKDEKPFALAGICDYWKDESGKELRSFSIITTDANQLIAKIHVFDMRAGDVLTKNPKTIAEDELAARALAVMEDYAITVLVVPDSDGRVRGIVHLHDILRKGIA